MVLIQAPGHPKDPCPPVDTCLRYVMRSKEPVIDGWGPRRGMKGQGAPMRNTRCVERAPKHANPKELIAQKIALANARSYDLSPLLGYLTVDVWVSIGHSALARKDHLKL